MAKQRQKPRERQIGKRPAEKKPLIDPRYKSLVWTSVTIVVLLIFFIINNTRDVPESGPLPPSYDQQTHESPDGSINQNLQMQHP